MMNQCRIESDRSDEYFTFQSKQYKQHSTTMLISISGHSETMKQPHREVRRRSRQDDLHKYASHSSTSMIRRQEAANLGCRRRIMISNRTRIKLIQVNNCIGLIMVILSLLINASQQLANSNENTDTHSGSFSQVFSHRKQVPGISMSQVVSKQHQLDTRTTSDIGPNSIGRDQDIDLRPTSGASSLLATRIKVNAPDSSLVGALRLSSGSKSEPPSRPQVEWSKQRPHFGAELARNVSVELGKSAYLTCRVLELGDKTVSWLKGEDVILTVGKYTYVGDPRFTAINDANNNNDWILEIKDVTLNDSTSYECQVSTDPKMSLVFNLQVKAAKARIKQGEQYSCTVGANIEFTCDSIGLGGGGQTKQNLAQNSQTYWYFNGNLLNYHAHSQSLPSAANQNQDQQQQQSNRIGQQQQPRNFTIERDFLGGQTSRFKLFNVQSTDSGNYTCKPTSAEPATIRLTVKKPNRNRAGGYYTANGQPQPVYHKSDSSKGRRFDANGLPDPNHSSNNSRASFQVDVASQLIAVLAATTSVLLTGRHLLQSLLKQSPQQQHELT